MELRAAVAGDGAILFRLISALATYERAPDAVVTTPAQLDAQLAEVPPPFECLLAQREGRPVGFALYFYSYSTWRGRPGLHLEDLFVEPAARQRGTGRALLTALAARAVARGCGRMEWSVLDWNTLAQGFYRGLGARPMEGWTTWRLSDEALTRLAAGGR